MAPRPALRDQGEASSASFPACQSQKSGRGSRPVPNLSLDLGRKAVLADPLTIDDEATPG